MFILHFGPIKMLTFYTFSERVLGLKTCFSRRKNHKFTSARICVRKGCGLSILEEDTQITYNYMGIVSEHQMNSYTQYGRNTKFNSK